MSKRQKVSEGKRRRLGRVVRDATEAIILPLPRAAIERARENRRHYHIDAPANFTSCVLAEALSALTGGRCEVMRRLVFIAFDGERFTRRYQLSMTTTDIVKLSDMDRFDAIPPNVTVTLQAPPPGRQLIAQGGPRVSKKSRGILANPPRPHPDPYRGIIRNGVHATHG